MTLTLRRACASHLLLGFLVVFCVAGIAEAQTGKVEQELMQLERDWCTANMKNDIAWFTRVFADDISSPSISKATKAQAIADAKAEKYLLLGRSDGGSSLRRYGRGDRPLRASRARMRKANRSRTRRRCGQIPSSVAPPGGSASQPNRRQSPSNRRSRKLHKLRVYCQAPAERKPDGSITEVSPGNAHRPTAVVLRGRADEGLRTASGSPQGQPDISCIVPVSCIDIRVGDLHTPIESL